MKNIFIILIVSYFSIFSIYASKPFFWADDQDYEPYVHKTENREIKGIFRDIIVEIFCQNKLLWKD